MVEFRNRTYMTKGPELGIAMSMIGKAGLNYTCFMGIGQTYCLTHTTTTLEEFKMHLIGVFLKVTVKEVTDLEDKAWRQEMFRK